MKPKLRNALLILAAVLTCAAIIYTNTGRTNILDGALAGAEASDIEYMKVDVTTSGPFISATVEDEECIAALLEIFEQTTLRKRLFAPERFAYEVGESYHILVGVGDLTYELFIANKDNFILQISKSKLVSHFNKYKIVNSERLPDIYALLNSYGYFDEDNPPAEPADNEWSKYDTNGDGKLQTLEFPCPVGAICGLTGDYAALYEAVAMEMRNRYGAGSPDDTMLIMPSLTLWGEYAGDNGEKNYVCGLMVEYFYDMGDDMSNITYSSSGGGGNLARITLAADGTLLDIQETYEGVDNTQRRIELCGPLDELAAVINDDEVPESVITRIMPRGDDLLLLYVDYFFPGSNKSIPPVTGEDAAVQ